MNNPIQHHEAYEFRRMSVCVKLVAFKKDS